MNTNTLEMPTPAAPTIAPAINLADRILTRCNARHLPSEKAFAVLHYAIQKQEEARADLHGRPFHLAPAPRQHCTQR